MVSINFCRNIESQRYFVHIFIMLMYGNIIYSLEKTNELQCYMKRILPYIK